MTVTLTAFGLTLLLAPHIEWAILAAIGASIAIHLWRELRLDVNISRQGHRLVAAPQGVLWFGNARVLRTASSTSSRRSPDATELDVRLDGLGRIDLSGALALRTLAETPAARGSRSRSRSPAPCEPRAHAGPRRLDANRGPLVQRQADRRLRLPPLLADEREPRRAHVPSPWPTSSCASLISCTNLGTVSSRSSGRNHS